MFKPESMVPLSVLILERDEPEALDELGRLGCVEFTRVPADEGMNRPGRSDLARRLAICEDLLARAAELRRVLEIPGPNDPVCHAARSLEEAEVLLRDLEQRTDELVARRGRLQSDAAEVETAGSQLAPFAALPFPLGRFGQSEFVHVVIGSLPAGSLDGIPFEERMVLVPMPLRGNRQPILAMTPCSAADTLDQLLRRAGFEPAELPDLEGGSPGEAMDRVRRRQALVRAEEEAVGTEWLQWQAESGPTLREVESIAAAERLMAEARQLFSRTESTVLIRGWVPLAQFSGVNERLRECTRGRCVAEFLGAGIESGGEVPVLLHHPRWLRPFEMLVTAYGLPRYGELVPTLFVAISFLLMFGIMFGDVGHGSLLALLGLALWRTGRTSRRRDIGLLLLFNGISSMGLGLIYGSCFGLPSMRRFALWRDPLEGNPMTLMFVAVGIGVILISLGLVLNTINRLRRGDWVEGFLGKFGFSGLVFYWTALWLATKADSVVDERWMFWLAGAFLLAPLFAWALSGPIAHARVRHPAGQREEGGLISLIAESAVGVFEGVLVYLANTVSFVRLAAYAMSHAALLSATFVLAAEVRNLAVGGAVLSLGVVALGNAVAVLLEGVVAAVQALRLEYYEFFGKFFSGEGRPFNPFILAPVPGGR